MICFENAHFAAIIILTVLGTAVIIGTVVWYYTKRRCSAEKLGKLQDSDANVAIVVDKVDSKGKHHSTFLKSHRQ
jgi:hypothetical protein